MRKALHIGLASIFAIALFSGSPAKAAGLTVGIRAIDHSCSTQQGPIQLTTGNATGWATDTNGFNPDCYKVNFSGAVGDQDFRIGIQMGDGSGCGATGSIRYTPWASQGGGWSGWVSQTKGFDPDCARLFIDTRPNSGAKIINARLGIQISDYTCTAQFGSVRYTPWASQGGGWSDYAADSNLYDPDCAQIGLETETERLGNVAVMTKTSDGAELKGTWKIRDASGNLVQSETAGASFKVYEKMPFGAYTVEAPALVAGYTLVNITPSAGQNLGAAAPAACAAGQSNPHLGCSSNACTLISGCGPANCSGCSGGRPGGDILNEEGASRIHTFIDKIVDRVLEVFLPRAEARADQPTLSDGEDRATDGGESYPHYACQDNACQEVNSWGVDSCSSNSECGGPSTPPPAPADPAPAPSPTQINFVLNYQRGNDGVVSCNPAAQATTEGESAAFVGTGPGTLNWTAVSGDPASGSGGSFTTKYSSVGTKEVKVSAGTASAICKVEVAACTGSIKVSSNLATGWTLTGPSPQTQDASNPSYGVTYTAEKKGGPYTLIPQEKAGYSWWIEDANGNKPMSSQSLTSCGGTLEFKIVYLSNGNPNNGLSCSPSSQSVEVGRPATLSASGGSSYSWSAPLGTPTTGLGSSYAVVFSSTGQKTVTLTGTNNQGDTKSVSCAVSVTPACPGTPTLVITPPDQTITVGQIASFKALYDEDGPSCSASNKMQNVDVSTDSQTAWSSSATNIATISSPGNAEGLAAGATGISARYRGLEATANLNVNSAGKDFSCTVTPSSIVVNQGESVTGIVRCRPLNGFTGPSILLSPVRVPTAAQMILNPPTIGVPPTATSQYTFTAGLTTPIGAYTMRVRGTATGGAPSHDVQVNVQVNAAPAKDLNVSLVANPASGNEPLLSALTASVGGTAAGSMNYTFWWNCAGYSGGNIAAATAQCGAPSATGNSNGIKFDGVSENPKATSHSYPAEGTYRPLVIVERGGLSAYAATNVTVTRPSAPASHAECVANACVQVAGSGPNRCSGNASCGSAGSASFHGACDAAQKACVNVAGPGASTCGSDPACSGAAPTHLTCEGNACVIVSGAGTNENGCSVVGSSCSIPATTGSCTFKANPNIVKKGDSTTLSWSCVGGITSCAILKTNISGGSAGSGRVSPPETTQYTLSCNGGTTQLPVSVYVVQSYKEVPPGN